MTRIYHPLEKGQKFGMLTAEGRFERRVQNGNPRVFEEFLCECGNTHFVTKSNVKEAKSCGCKRHMGPAWNRSHGESRTRLYSIYQQMIGRCANPKLDNWKHYGGRGVTVCQEWKSGYEKFKEWALNNGYSTALTLDRFPDRDGNYGPDNCRWATKKEQSRNRDYARMITAFGETKRLAEWIEDSRCNITRSALKARLKLGWQPEDAITHALKINQFSPH